MIRLYLLLGLLLPWPLLADQHADLPPLSAQEFGITGTFLEDGQWSHNVLALSWHVGFCHFGKQLDANQCPDDSSTPDPTLLKVECNDPAGNSLKPGDFALHGLWPAPHSPQTKYCFDSEDQAQHDTSADSCWNRYDPVELADPHLRQALNRLMPGQRSNLDEHEYHKHGSCYIDDRVPGSQKDDAYFKDAVWLTQAFNALAFVTQDMPQYYDRRVTIDTLKQAIAQALGDASLWNRVYIGIYRGELVDVHLRLAGDIHPQASLLELVRAANPFPYGPSTRKVYIHPPQLDQGPLHKGSNPIPQSDDPADPDPAIPPTQGGQD